MVNTGNSGPPRSCAARSGAVQMVMRSARREPVLEVM